MHNICIKSFIPEVEVIYDVAIAKRSIGNQCKHLTDWSSIFHEF
jgi:hypothetical protein